MLFSFRQNISTFCLQNSDFIGVFSIRPAWDAYDVLNNVSIHKQVATDYGLNDEELIVYDILRGRYTCRFIPDYAKAAKQIVTTINNVESKPKNREIFYKRAKDVILEMGMKYNIKRERMFARGKIQQTPVEQSKKDLYGLKLYLMRKRNEKFGIV